MLHRQLRQLEPQAIGELGKFIDGQAVAAAMAADQNAESVGVVEVVRHGLALLERTLPPGFL